MSWITNIKERFQLARPRNLEFEGGTVSLQGFSKEVADKIEDHVSSVFKDGPPTLLTESEASEKPKATQGALTHVAVGTYFDKGGWYTVTVKYSPISHEASVDKVTAVGPEKAESIEKFKILAVENNLV